MKSNYTKEFKDQALSLVAESSVKEVSERLGITTKTLYRWRQEKRLEGSPQAMRSDLEKQNRELRKENEELRQANTILKKAMGFFVKG